VVVDGGDAGTVWTESPDKSITKPIFSAGRPLANSGFKYLGRMIGHVTHCRATPHSRT